MDTQILVKSGTQIHIRSPRAEDLNELTRYANALSEEDTFVVLSGEKFTHEEELGHLRRWIDEIAKGDRVQVFAFVENQLVANAEVRRVVKSRTRQLHVGEIAISVAKDWRGQGLGREILKILIHEAKNTLKLRLVTLTTFAVNMKALSLYESLGFNKAGEIPGAIIYKGVYIGQIYLYLPLS